MPQVCNSSWLLASVMIFALIFTSFLISSNDLMTLNSKPANIKMKMMSIKFYSTMI